MPLSAHTPPSSACLWRSDKVQVTEEEEALGGGREWRLFALSTDSRVKRGEEHSCCLPDCAAVLTLCMDPWQAK